MSHLRNQGQAKAEIFYYGELIYNPTRRHGNDDGVSAMEYEKWCFEKLSAD